MPDFVHVAQIDLDCPRDESMDVGLDRVHRISLNDLLCSILGTPSGQKSCAGLLEEIGR